MELVEWDYFGPLEPDPITGDRYACVVCDHLTTYIWGKTFPDKRQENGVEFLYNLCLTWGAPENIMADNGGEVSNKLVNGN